MLLSLVLKILSVLAGVATETPLTVQRLVGATFSHHCLRAWILHQALVEVDFLYVLLLDLSEDLPDLPLAELEHVCVVFKPSQECQKQLKRYSRKDDVLPADLRDYAQ